MRETHDWFALQLSGSIKSRQHLPQLKTTSESLSTLDPWDVTARAVWSHYGVRYSWLGLCNEWGYKHDFRKIEVICRIPLGMKTYNDYNYLRCIHSRKESASAFKVDLECVHTMFSFKVVIHFCRCFIPSWHHRASHASNSTSQSLESNKTIQSSCFHLLSYYSEETDVWHFTSVS